MVIVWMGSQYSVFFQLRNSVVLISFGMVFISTNIWLCINDVELNVLKFNFFIKI